jgi:hypothetical protein
MHGEMRVVLVNAGRDAEVIESLMRRGGRLTHPARFTGEHYGALLSHLTTMEAQCGFEIAQMDLDQYAIQPI